MSQVKENYKQTLQKPPHYCGFTDNIQSDGPPSECGEKSVLKVKEKV